MIRRLFYANLKLGTRQKFERKKLIICRGDALSFTITMAQNFVRKSSQKIFQLDYTFQLEVLIKGNVLTFTDDKAKRYEINKRFVLIAAKATGYSRLQENNRQVKRGIRQKCKKNPRVRRSIKIYGSWTSAIIMITIYGRQQ